MIPDMALVDLPSRLPKIEPLVLHPLAGHLCKFGNLLGREKSPLGYHLLAGTKLVFGLSLRCPFRHEMPLPLAMLIIEVQKITITAFPYAPHLPHLLILSCKFS